MLGVYVCYLKRVEVFCNKSNFLINKIVEILRNIFSAISSFEWCPFNHILLLTWVSRSSTLIGRSYSNFKIIHEKIDSICCILHCLYRYIFILHDLSCKRKSAWLMLPIQQFHQSYHMPNLSEQVTPLNRCKTQAYNLI